MQIKLKVLMEFFLHEFTYLNGPLLDLCYNDTVCSFLAVTFMDILDELPAAVLPW